ncbi:MAG TPA: ribbon-helix-helix protein, CopG family [Dehalococcoidia bacterium]|nr:ribbon-helix-helix protein, CopG family [Dehalococcoidia bacterium]
MRVLRKRVQLLLSQAQYEELRRIAKGRRRSLGALIREAIDREYLHSHREAAIVAVEELASLSLPVASWEEMEKESVEAALE